MGAGENFWAATGGDGLAKTGSAIGKGDWKGAWEANKNNIADVTTLGLSKGSRDKKKTEDEAAKAAAENSEKLGVEVDASLKRQGVMNDEYKKYRNAGVDQMDVSDMNYESRLGKLSDEARSSATDANIVHTSMSNKYRGMQDDADREVRSAMTVGEFNDPNNRVSRGVRDVYNAEGDRTQGDYNAEGDNLRGQYNDEGVKQQGMYDQQATGETRRGQADYGVLSALGAQSMGQGGMGPMTVGQQMAMMSQSQRQAGEAYAGAQRRVQGLRDQGLQANTMNRDRGLEQYSARRGQGLDAKTGTRARGIESGFQRSDAAFAAGENARDRQGRVMDSRRGLENDYRGFQFSSRGERDGLSQNQNASESRRANRLITTAQDNRGIGMQQEAGRMAEQMRRNGASESAIQVKLQQSAAEQASYAKAVGTGVSVAGTVGGGMMGGPAGAAAGSRLGGFVPGQEAPEQAKVPQDRFMQGEAPNAQGSVSNFRPQSQSDQGGAFGSYLQRKYPSRSSQNA